MEPPGIRDPKRPVRLCSHTSRAWALSLTHFVQQHVTSGWGQHTARGGDQGHNPHLAEGEVTVAAAQRQQEKLQGPTPAIVNIFFTQFNQL